MRYIVKSFIFTVLYVCALSACSNNSNKHQEEYYFSPYSKESFESIRVGLESIKGKIYLQYSEYLKETPGLSGTIIYSFVVEPDGSASNIKIEKDEINIESIRNKIVEELSAVKFEIKEKTSKKIKYKMVFLPN